MELLIFCSREELIVPINVISILSLTFLHFALHSFYTIQLKNASNYPWTIMIKCIIKCLFLIKNEETFLHMAKLTCLNFSKLNSQNYYLFTGHVYCETTCKFITRLEVHFTWKGFEKISIMFTNISLTTTLRRFTLVSWKPGKFEFCI